MFGQKRAEEQKKKKNLSSLCHINRKTQQAFLTTPKSVRRRVNRNKEFFKLLFMAFHFYFTYLCVK